MTLQNVGGVFLVLVVGSIMGVFVAFGELLMGVCSRSYTNKVSFREELITELKFFVACKGQTKPNTVGAAKSMSRIASTKTLDENMTATPYGFLPELSKNEKM